MLNAPAFWFLRHGETDWNARLLAQGRVEVALNARGLAQAHDAARLLAAHPPVGRPVAAIVSSPLLRARVTAEIVGAALGLPVALDPDLVECAYGDHEGRPMEGWFDDWVAGRFTPEGGESFTELRVRAAAAAARCTAQPGPVLIVAHGALMRALRAEMGCEPNIRTPNAVPIRCDPPDAAAAAWRLTPFSL